MRPGVEPWLSEGGDTRIALDAAGRNAYGCPPRPDPGLLAFGSSTASVISETGLAAAERLRARVFAADGLTPAAYAGAMEALRAELSALCGIDDLPGVSVLCAASGTDVHLVATQLLAAEGLAPLTVLIAGAGESGSGVPLALSGRHFSTRTALGASVDCAEPLDGSAHPAVTDVPIREATGELRPAEKVDAEIALRAGEVLAAGGRVLLVLVDVSKTGCVAPSLGCALSLLRCFPDRVSVLVDACQFRLAPVTLRTYLMQGCMVAVSGSKFLTGPAFSGALLVPGALSARLCDREPARALQAYCTRGDWPPNWPARASLQDRSNPGLLLRWAAALAELRAFRDLPDTPVAAFVAQFGRAIEERLMRESCLVPLPVLPIHRAPFSEGGWDTLPTIFPFLLKTPSGQWVSREAARQHWWTLATGERRCQLGQPVACGMRDGVPVSALRLCLSARLIVEALAPGGRGAGQVIADAQAALDLILQVGAGRD